jgi:hypothetical protein
MWLLTWNQCDWGLNKKSKFQQRYTSEKATGRYREKDNHLKAKDTILENSLAITVISDL